MCVKFLHSATRNSIKSTIPIVPTLFHNILPCAAIDFILICIKLHSLRVIKQYGSLSPLLCYGFFQNYQRLNVIIYVRDIQIINTELIICVL